MSPLIQRSRECVDHARIRIPSFGVGMNTRYRVDCELNYQVLEPSNLIFKIEAAHVSAQRLYKALTRLPPVLLDRHSDWPGYRSVRAAVPACNFSICYPASVEISQQPVMRA